MSFWHSNKITADNMAKLGPYVDGFVGTNGKYSTLNAAVAAGWTEIIVAPGATLSADLNLTAKCSIIGLMYSADTITGNYCINVQGDDSYLAGFRLSNTAGKGIYVTGSRCRLERITVQNCLSHGIHFNASGGDHELLMIIAYGNGGDGIRFEANNTARASHIRSQSNTGWGINDLTNVLCLSTTRVAGNTAGQINGATTYHDASVRI